ncbi:MAG: hypothetical protein A2297_05895 [Elusimicrobia bacterium RIFOXYB2_FULL_48_7]|nr:MAG: hypothetical protein A2297_05895 [Elusimicrobia bacterium RIFOXYB2_FULL_48_7]
MSGKLNTKKYVVGVDLGGTTVSIALFNRNLDMKKHVVVPTEAAKGIDYILTKISKCISGLIEEEQIIKSDLSGIGFGSPGPLNTDKGIVFSSPNLKGWKNVPVKKLMEKKTGIPVYLENDANAAALGEWRKGSGKGVKNMLFVTLGTGVGGGLVLNGRLFHGKNDAAGEIGHVVLFPDGIKCNCGNHGCIEMYSSATGIVRRTKEALKTGIKSTLSQHDANFTSKDVHQAALKRDKLACRIMEDTGKYLGIVFSSISHLLDLDMIVIGGNVSNAGKMLLDPIRKEFLLRTMYPARNVKIAKASLGPDAGVIGAACTVLERLGK